MSKKCAGSCNAFWDEDKLEECEDCFKEYCMHCIDSHECEDD